MPGREQWYKANAPGGKCPNGICTDCNMHLFVFLEDERFFVADISHFDLYEQGGITYVGKVYGKPFCADPGNCLEL